MSGALTLISGLAPRREPAGSDEIVCADLPIPSFLSKSAQPRATLAPSLAMSAALHVLVAAAFPVFHWNAAPERVEKRVAESMQVRIGEQIYFIRPAPPPPVRRALAPRAIEAPAAARAPAAAAAPAAPAAPAPIPAQAAARRQFALPAAAAATTKSPGPMIFQPSAPPDVEVPAANVPTVAVWTMDRAMPKAPPARRYVTPGPKAREMAVSSQPKLEAAPELETPMVATVERPKLLRPFAPPPAATVGAAARDGGAGIAGDAVRLITEGPGIAPDQIATIPRAHRVPGIGEAGTLGLPGALPAAPPAVAAAGPRSGAGAAAGSGLGGGVRAGGAGAGAGTGSGSGSAAGPGAASGAGLAGSAGSAAGIGGDALGAALAALAAIPNAPPVVRVDAVKGGQFDAILVQSSVLASIPESRGLLRGRPIYTAYVGVGTRKDWILHYADPKTAQATGEGPARVVRLEAGAPVAAPYPVVMFRPGLVSSPGERYLVFAGVLGSGGKFQELRSIRQGKAETVDFLLRCLKIWEFRPAMRDGVPVDVEFVLAVPTDRGEN